MKLGKFINPMLRLNALMPGDVVLTRGRSAFASLNIAMQVSLKPTAGTRELYSHAALVVAPPYDWFESQGYGIGPSLKKLDKIEMRPDGVYRLSRIDRGEIRSIQILRHPVVTALSATREDIPTLINECALNYLGFSYPFVTELADAATMLKHFPLLRDKTVSLYDQLSPGTRPMCPGPFCSELIVSIFEDLAEKLGVDVRVTRGSHEASAISPSDLAYPVLSRLEAVNGVIVEMDPSIPDRYSLLAKVAEGVDKDEIRQILDNAARSAGGSLDYLENHILGDMYARSDESVKDAENRVRLITTTTENNQKLLEITDRLESLSRFVSPLEKPVPPL